MGLVNQTWQKYLTALKFYGEAIRLNPNYADAWYNKGVVLYILGKTWSKQKKRFDAIKAFDEAILRVPNDADAWYAKCLTFETRRDYCQAINACEIAIRINPTKANVWGEKLKKLQEKQEAQIKERKLKEESSEQKIQRWWNEELKRKESREKDFDDQIMTRIRDD